MAKIIITGEYNSNEPITEDEYEMLMDCLAQCGISEIDIKEEE
jgi:hypothetical protein